MKKDQSSKTEAQPGRAQHRMGHTERQWTLDQDREVPLGLAKLKFRRISERLKIKNKNNIK